MGDAKGIPIQILDFHVLEEAIDGKRQSKIVLDKKALNSVFIKGGNRPVVLISIAGPCRKGKSFFLDFVIRYLEALVQDNPDWIGHDNQTKPLTGFVWGNGYEIQTSGIWLWSEPFILTIGRDKECAVFVMDTQGVFDEHTDEHEWCSIIGLSLLTSSCTILNLKDLLEDSMSMIGNFIQYGLMCKTENDFGTELDEKPFQKLLFLFRDWDNIQEFPYGEIGGRKFLDKKLSLDGKAFMSEDSQKVRKNIRKCFDELDCFLFPPPGEKAKELTFDGSIQHLDKKFITNIINCIERQLNPEELKPKMIGGIEITSESFGNYFEMFVDIFNSDETPKATTIYEATTQITNQDLIQKFFQQYKQKMSKVPVNEYGFKNKLKLKQHHEKIVAQVLDDYKKSRKLGNETIWNQFSTKLLGSMNDEYAQIIENNNSRIERVMQRESKALIEDYDKKLKERITQDYFLEKDEFILISGELKQNSIDAFSEIFTDEVGNLQLDELKQQLEILEKDHKVLNQLLRTEAIKSNEDSVLLHSNKYEAQMKDELSKFSFLLQDELEVHHNKVFEDVILEFQNDENRKKKVQMLQNYEMQLGNLLTSKFETYKEKNEKNLLQTRLKIENLINELMLQFEAELRNEFKDLKFKAASEFVELFDKLEKKLGNNYDEMLRDITVTQTFLTPFENSLNTKISDLKTKLQKEYEEKKLKVKNLIESEQNELIEAFTKALDLRLSQSTVPNLDEFEKLCKVNMDASIAEFQESLSESFSSIDIEEQENHAKSLAEALSNSQLKYKQQLELKIETAHSQAKNLVTQAKEFYQQEMLPYVTDKLPKHETEFQKLHLEILEKANQEFLSNGFSVDDFSKPYLKDIKTGADELYTQLLQLFKLKKDEAEANVKTNLENAKKYYAEEMEKHVQNDEFLEPKVFEGFNKLARTNALKKCSIPSAQEAKLNATFDILYQEYKKRNDMNTPTNPAIGIDLGTTYSCVAVYNNGKLKTIQNDGKSTTPSYVAYKNDGTKLVGYPAKSHAYIEPENTIYDAKRLIGLTFGNPVVQKDISNWPFTVIDERDIPKIQVHGKNYHPEEISSEVLKQMKVAAETYVGCEVKNAVITVPAYFTDGQKAATIDAGTLAGLNVLKIVPEPTAAAVAYRNQHKKIDTSEKKVFIFDLGGGTFDVAILKVSGSEIECLGIDGDTHLGGEDFDQNLVDYCIEEHLKSTGVNLKAGLSSANPHDIHQAQRTIRRIRNLCEERKRDLSSGTKVDIKIDIIDGTNDLNVTVTRDKFEKLNQHHFDETLKIVQRVLQKSEIAKGEIDDVVLVGGSTRIPKVQEMLTTFFGERPLNKSVHQDEAVAHGAAILAAVINGGIAIKSGDYAKLTDITPRSLGVEVYGGGFDVIIPKSTKIPKLHKEIYKTAHNNQTSVEIVVYEGEDPVAAKNNLLGKFYLNGIPPGDAGIEEISVDMNINEQGILHVTAVCKSTGRQKDLVIREHKLRMSKATIQKLLDAGS